ncbi:MAG: type I glyceraldehyde-3-phosphate dehydrogenase [Bacteroidales bacterium]|nr:type I glyceraldehyde-3-phosphate dehydrogenase [Bacteroidales bacterium]
MMIRVGINGFGRIGRLVFRLMQQRSDMQLVAVNDPMLLKTLMHLLKYDTVHGRFGREVWGDEATETLFVDGRPMQKYSHFHPDKIPWDKHDVDVVVESSGLFLTRDMLQGHLRPGVKKVILSCPPKEKLDSMVVIGVNDHMLTPEHLLVSNASCTTNCVAPVLKVLEDQFGIDRVFLNTVHPYTNNQNVIDSPHHDLRRARNAADNIIPTTTSAIKAVKEILPSLKDRFDGFATRVPVSDGSFVELSAILKSNTSVEEVNSLFEMAAQGQMKGIIQYCEDPIVSSDVIGNSHSAVFDALSTRVLGGNFVQVLAWYDNEYGYSSRMIDLIALLMK